MRVAVIGSSRPIVFRVKALLGIGLPCESVMEMVTAAATGDETSNPTASMLIRPALAGVTVNLTCLTGSNVSGNGRRVSMGQSPCN